MTATVGGAGKSLYMAYESDDGNTYQLKTSKQNLDSGSITPIARGSHADIPVGYKPRHAWGYNAAEKIRTKIIMPDRLDSDWEWPSEGTFDKFGVTFTVTSMIGERRLTV